VIDSLKWVGLGERMDALPPILSGGEKQRAAIARAVISRPQLLLRTSRPAASIRRWAGGCCGCSSNSTNPAPRSSSATHDITLMDQYEARRLVLHQGRLHIYE